MSLVEDGNGMFAGERTVPVGEFDFEGIVIDPFEEAISQLPMNLHGGADDGVSLGVSLGISVHCRLGFELFGGFLERFIGFFGLGRADLQGPDDRFNGSVGFGVGGVGGLESPGMVASWVRLSVAGWMGRLTGENFCSWTGVGVSRISGRGGFGVNEKAGLGRWGRYGDGKIMKRRQPCEY